MNDILRLLGRLALAGIFLGAAFGKITKYSDTIETMEKVGIPMVQVALPAAILFLVAGGLSVVTGYLTTIGCLLLLAFLGAATFYFHLDFPAQQIAFMKNVAIAGGLLTLMGAGPGRFAVGSAGETTKS
jgi:putative oxidoreductase